jgi:hypothetical protein
MNQYNKCDYPNYAIGQHNEKLYCIGCGYTVCKSENKVETHSVKEWAKQIGIEVIEQ